MSEDYTTMNNPRFIYRAALHRPLPDWVVAEPMPEQGEFQKRAAAAFADTRRRLLPICTKSAAFHSMLNIAAHPDDYDEVAFNRVKEACCHYGIEQDVAPYLELFVGELEKSAADNDIPVGRFAIHTEMGGQTLSLFPINNESEVRSSAHELAKMAADARIHVLQFVPAAREIVKAASDYGVVDTLHELVLRAGTPRFPDAERAAKLLEGREDLCKDASIRDALREDYKSILDGLEDDPDAAMTKLAAIDHAAGIRTNYKLSSHVSTPFDIVFSGALVEDAEKAAMEHLLLRDVLVPFSEIKRIPVIDATYKLSKSAADEFARLVDADDARDLSLAAARWPEEDQKTLLRLAVNHAA